MYNPEERNYKVNFTTDAGEENFCSISGLFRHCSECEYFEGTCQVKPRSTSKADLIALLEALLPE
jgi:hypothetical protein